MRYWTVLLAFLLGACSHASVRYDSGGGTVATSASVSAGYSGSNAAAWALIGIGLIAAELAGSEAARGRGLEPERPAEGRLDAGRQVNEVDCTRQIENWTSNLRCK